MLLCVIMCVSLFLFTKSHYTLFGVVYFLQSGIKRLGFHVEHGLFSHVNQLNCFVVGAQCVCVVNCELQNLIPTNKKTQIIL